MQETNLLSLSYGRIIKKDINTCEGLLPASFETYNIVAEGDIVFRLTDLQNDQRSLRTGLCTQKGIITSAYITLRSNIELDNRYMHYLYHAYDICKVFYGMGDGVRQGMNFDDLKKLLTLFPAIQEQQKIADFLDDKCAKIDSLISHEEATIEELKVYKQSVITEAVTKGLDKTVPMKDSGVEWIGKIPAHWDIARNKDLFSYRNERNFEALENVNLISLYTDLGVVQHSDVEHTTGNKAVTADGYKIVKENDIVVNIILCWMGAIGRSAYNGVTSPAYDIYAPKNGTNTRFYNYYFRTKGFNGDCFRYGRGIMLMRWRTYSDEFRAISVVKPPIKEQEGIADYLDKKCADIDSLISIKQQKIEELKEYKKSLIYEYVTGKKEVA